MADKKEIKGIKELLAETKNSSDQVNSDKVDNFSDINITHSPTIRTQQVTEEFEKKMKDIRIKELEKETAVKGGSQGYPYIDLGGFPVSDYAIASIPKEVSKKEKTVCFYNDEKQVRIGAIQPSEKTKEILADIIKDHTVDGEGKIYIISQHSFDEAFHNYDRLPEIKDVKYGIEITGNQLNELRPKVSNFGKLNTMINVEKNMTSLFAMLVAGALEIEASDIHIEAEESAIILRYRIDGVMHQVGKMDKKIWDRLDSRIKGIAGLKINVKEKPQDGRITIYLPNQDNLELRVSTLPTSFGESIVMRLLKSKTASLGFNDLGLRGSAYNNLKTAIEKTTGMVVTTGPTGSGKTTTLYAILNELNDGNSKIITLEDPIEYKIAGISQSQIDRSQGYSFADGLRSILRQDPDVIMVGELRDLETAEVSIDASLTGHRVVSTIHTNDAAGAVPRFLSMGVKPYLLSPALNAVIGQRLVRKICDNCKVPYQPEPALIEKAQKIMDMIPENSGYEKVDLSNHQFLRGGGCEECKHIGYKGRRGIFEIFLMNEAFEKMILAGNVSEYDMAKIAAEQGMITMVEDGLLKAVEGVTTIDEVFRIAG